MFSGNYPSPFGAHALGTINHNLLSIEALRARSTPSWALLSLGQIQPQQQNLQINFTVLCSPYPPAMLRSLQYPSSMTAELQMPICARIAEQNAIAEVGINGKKSVALG